MADSRTLIRSDQIRLQTDKAPWMDVALKELGKNIYELAADDSFVNELRRQLTNRAQIDTVDRQMEAFRQQSLLLRNSSGGTVKFAKPLLGKALKDPVPGIVGGLEATSLKKANPQIDKYFQGLKTDPVYDKKGHSWDIGSTYESEGYARIAPWCAAFVNWCLSEAKAPHLGYATAKSWLGFGTPVASPVRGCVTIVKPSKSTGSTTGHIAFYCETVGNRVALVGGNQHKGKVSISKFASDAVLGYRWPTNFNHYLLATPRGTTIV